MNKRLRLPLALSLALGSSSAFALGLGQIEVKSALNQPLSAEIPVISTGGGETDALVVRLAPPEALARVGLPEPTGVAANLEFALDTNASGDTVIRVSTPDDVTEPFVSFLIEVDWGKGRMLREYTVLLDPPSMAPIRSAPVAAPVSAPEPEPVPTETSPAPEPEPAAVFEPVPEAEPAPAEAPPPPEMVSPEPTTEPAPEIAPEPEPQPESSPEPEPVAETPAPEPEPVPEPVPEPAPSRVDTYGPVQTGETLWSIAQYARGDESISMNQMMLALLHANPDAFIDQNINRLKRGAVLRIPSRDEAMVIAAADAAAQVREQMQTWRATQPATIQPAEPEPEDSTAPRATAATPPTSDSRLELVPPRGPGAASSAQSGASADGEGRELRAELARSQEQVGALTQENIELKSRVGELEKIQSDSERLIELKDSELAAAQQRLTELEAQQQAAAAQPPIEPAGTTPAEVAATPGTETTDPTSEPVADPAATEPATDATAGTEATSEPTADPTTAAPSDTTGSEPVATEAAPAPAPEATPWYMNLWVWGGGLVLLGLIALVLGRRKAAPAAAPGSRLSDSLGSGGYGGLLPKTAAAAQAEAEDDLDREAELVDAVMRDPGNLNRHLDLVRHHYENSDAEAFERAAESMHGHVKGNDNLAWKQVVAMGREIAPEHPLFVEPARAPVPAPMPARAPAPVVPPPAAPAPPPAAPAPKMDWRTPPPADSGTTQQLRLDDVKSAAPARSPAPVAAPPPADLTPTFDIPDIEPVPEFDTHVPEPVLAPTETFVDADAASTKLELARAYLDMGDVDGARGMLEEVVSEGNPGQRAEAKRLLDEIR